MSKMSQVAEVPKPPDDPELRNIIDKLAQFVAKNGQDFENMTKQKQKDNPRFSFLYGGEYFHYYTYRVTVEQALARKRQQVEQHQNVQQTKIQMLQAQIQESDRNLKAQQEVLMKQQENEISDTIRTALDQQIFQVAEELRLNVAELASILDGLAFPYAQEGQEEALTWIISHYSTPKHGELLVRYLLERVKDPRDYLQRKMCILLLVGSLVQRSMQDQNEHMVALLNRFAPIMSSYAMKLHGHQDERARGEIDKLVRAWIQQRLFGDMAEWRCQNIDDTIGQYQNELKTEYPEIVNDVTQRIQSQYRQYEMQHHEYARHIQQQIASEQYQHQQASMMAAQHQHQPIPGQAPEMPSQQQPTPTQPQPRRSRFDDAGPSAISGIPSQAPPPPSIVHPVSQGIPGSSPWQQPPPLLAGAITNRPPPSGGPGAPPGMYNQPPPNLSPSMVRFPPPPASHQHQPPFQHAWSSGGPAGAPPQGPWMSGPPPGISPGQQPFGPALPPPGVCVNVNISQPPPKPMIDEQSLIPKVAYYDLPAGLMTPLVKLEDHEYEPLTPSDLRLPPPMPPSERLLAAVEAFYAPPNHENPRDSDGWERLGLYEYYKEKGKATQRANSKSKKNHSDRDSESRERHHGARSDESDEEKTGRRNDSARISSKSPHGNEKSRDRDRSPSPDKRRHRSRRSRSSESSSRDDSRSSRSSDRSNSESDSRSPHRSTRHKKDKRKEKRDHDHRSSQRSHDREDTKHHSDEDNDRDRNRHRGFSGSQEQQDPNGDNSPPPAAHAVDPFENFRRTQSAGFNQRLKAAFHPQPR